MYLEHFRQLFGNNMWGSYTNPRQQAAAQELEGLGGRVCEGEQKVYDDVIKQAKNDSARSIIGMSAEVSWLSEC